MFDYIFSVVQGLLTSSISLILCGTRGHRGACAQGERSSLGVRGSGAVGQRWFCKVVLCAKGEDEPGVVNGEGAAVIRGAGFGSEFRLKDRIPVGAFFSIIHVHNRVLHW